MQANPAWPQLVVRSLALMLAYAAGGRLGLFFSDATTHITLVWPATGIAVAAFYRWGWRCWPGVFLGTILVERSIPYTWHASACIAIGNTLAPMLASEILHRAQFDERLGKHTDGLKILLASAVGMLVSAAGGTIILWATGKIPAAVVWPASLRWWMGDSAGVLMITPFLLACSRHEW